MNDRKKFLHGVTTDLALGNSFLRYYEQQELQKLTKTHNGDSRLRTQTGWLTKFKLYNDIWGKYMSDC